MPRGPKQLSNSSGILEYNGRSKKLAHFCRILLHLSFRALSLVNKIFGFNDLASGVPGGCTDTKRFLRIKKILPKIMEV